MKTTNHKMTEPEILRDPLRKSVEWTHELESRSSIKEDYKQTEANQ